MRGATECARRVRALFNSLRSRLGKVALPSVGDPITQLILGILSRNAPEAKANEALDKLRGAVVDFNELRVIPSLELVQLLGEFPDARLKCEDISRALNAVFAREHTVSLDRLSGLSRKDALAYLQSTDGLEAYTVARVRLLGLRHHAIPLDEAMWALARREQLVSPRCPHDEAQHFLERHVPEEDGVEFVALFKRHSWNEMGAAVRRGEVERVLSKPPDRSARNMLQLVSFSATPEGDEESLGELAAGEDRELPGEAELAAVTEPAPAPKTRADRRPAARRARPAAPAAGSGKQAGRAQGGETRRAAGRRSAGKAGAGTRRKARAV